MLAACATPPATERIAPGAERQQFSGRMAVKVEGDAPRSVTAVFDLKGSAAAGSLSLATPLGSTLAQADWSAERVVLITPKGSSRYDKLDDLTRDVLGEPIPLAAMFDWLRARPWPGAPVRPVPASGSNAAQLFEQLGWTVDLRHFDTGLVEVRREGPPPVDVRVRLD